MCYFYGPVRRVGRAGSAHRAPPALLRRVSSALPAPDAAGPGRRRPVSRTPPPVPDALGCALVFVLLVDKVEDFELLLG
jgi:hypothetical protein